jgi:HK97 gp10 family phage protein
MIRSPKMVQVMEQLANQIKDKAEATAPVGDPKRDKHSGRYRDSFTVSSGADGGFKKNRAYGRVSNDAPEAFYVEYGTSKMEARHTLLNAAKSIGK